MPSGPTKPQPKPTPYCRLYQFNFLVPQILFLIRYQQLSEQMHFEIDEHSGAQAVGTSITNWNSETAEATILACLNELNTLCRSRFWDVQRQEKCRTDFESLRRIFLTRDATGALVTFSYCYGSSLHEFMPNPTSPAHNQSTW